MKIKFNFWLIVGIVLFSAVLAVDIYTDLRSGYEIDHVRGLALRMIGMLPCIVCLVAATRQDKYTVIIVIVIAMIGFNYLNLFDGLYNVFRGYGWFFTGSEDGKGDAVTDNVFQSIPLWATIVIKIGGSLLSIFVYTKKL